MERSPLHVLMPTTLMKPCSADRLVMMTNGPAAKIGEVMQIPFTIAIGLWKIRNTTSCGTTL